MRKRDVVLVLPAFFYPLANMNLHTLIAALRYHLTSNWSLKGEYRCEQFRETD